MANDVGVTETDHRYLNEGRGGGSRTRLLRFAPGVFTTEPFVHDY
jgi:hypothetical protein